MTTHVLGATVALQLLLRRPAPGLWSVPQLFDDDVAELRALDRPMLRFDLRSVDTKDAVLGALGAQGGFPRYYGRNWDAAYDCLTDLQPEIVVVQVADNLEGATAGTLISLFADAADHWLGRGLATYVLWVGPTTKRLPSLASQPRTGGHMRSGSDEAHGQTVY